MAKAALRVSEGFKAFVLDQLGPLGVTARSMFGGVGLYKDDVFFAILAGDVLYLKTDDRNRPAFERAGMPPFKPYPNRSGTMRYFAVPLDVLEDSRALVAWSRAAVAAGMTSRRPSSNKPRRR